jgi:hypothetical protein
MKKSVLVFLVVLMALGTAAYAKPTVVLGPGLNSGRTPYHQNYNRTLSADTTYILTGLYYVDSTYAITIPAGTVVKGDTAATLIIKRGAQVFSLGEQDKPVVMTSLKPAGQRARGDWGGVIILGEAPVNQVNPLIEGGIIEGTYGGTDPNDDSGIFKYTRIEYPGYRFQLNNEVNGLTMGGVGDGTEIHHVQVSYSFDDSYEWFGGTVDAKYLIALGGTDDEFDTDFGYSGNVQFAFGLKDPTVWDPNGQSNGIESDNEGSSPYTSTPYTSPTFSNVTLVGPERTDAWVGNLPVGHRFQYGAVLRRNTRHSVFNSCIMGYPWGISLRDNLTKTSASTNVLDLKESNLQASAIPTGSTHIHDETRWPAADPMPPGVLAWVNTVAYNNEDSDGAAGTTSMPSYIDLRDMSDFNDPDPRPTMSSPLVTNGTDFTHPKLLDPFFDSVSYRGAFDPSLPMEQQWSDGWAEFDPQGWEEDVALCGVVLGPGLNSGRTPYHQNYDRTLSADTLYYLTGLYYVDSTYTLTIPAGTIVRGDTAATLIIKRGAKIYATGTRHNPIVFTSLKPACTRQRGDWGGIIILGEAPVNQVNPLIEGGIIEGTYGGNNPNDNSGILSYVRIEYPGYRFQLNNEVNGLTMGGVGQGTQIDHIQVSYSFDDSYEWFGGTVDCKYLVAYGGTDDEFDTDFGYSGRVQYAFGLRDPNVWDPNGQSNGFESDNEGSSPYTSKPYTSPAFCNVTLVGPERVDTLVNNLPVGHRFQYGAVLRRNTQTSVYNSCIMGYPWGMSLRDDSTKLWANLDTLQFRMNNMQASGIPTGSTHIHDENRWPVTDPIPPGVLAWINTVGYGNQDSSVPPGTPSMPSYIQLTNMHDLKNPDPRPLVTSPLVTNGTNFSYPQLQLGGFFDSTSYRGAFDPNLPMDQQWTADWTNFDPCADPYLAGIDDIEDPAKKTRTLLAQNYPNPFSRVTNLRYTVPQDGHISLRVYNVQGQEVATLVDEFTPAGTYEVAFNTVKLAPGAYFYSLKGKGFAETRKMILMK